MGSPTSDFAPPPPQPGDSGAEVFAPLFSKCGAFAGACTGFVILLALCEKARPVSLAEIGVHQ
jgi:hypothetical protein